MNIVRNILPWTIALILIAIGAAIAYSTRSAWVADNSAPQTISDEDTHAHNETDDSIVLSEQARRNLDLKVGTVQLGEYWRSITVPGTVVERPGHSHRKIVAPVTGIVREFYLHPNQVVHPGDRIADLELKGDALATAQGELLQVVRELELNRQELNRVTDLVETGNLPEKNKLELQYARQRLESQLQSKSQQLEVLGLTSVQIDQIKSSRQLIRSFTLTVPEISSEEKGHIAEANSLARLNQSTEQEPAASKVDKYVYTVESVDCFPGKQLQAGDEIASLAFHVVLYVEGQAFEREGAHIEEAMRQQWPVNIRFESGAEKPLVRTDQKILFVDNLIDTDSRTFRFYIALANEVAHDSVGPHGEPYRSWRFKPGQKVQLDIPIEKFTSGIVLPAEAVVREGPHAYVFRVNGNKFERQSVEVLHTGRDSVVLANDGSLFPGESVAWNSAYQLNLAIRKATGEGGHAGHSHEGHSH